MAQDVITRSELDARIVDQIKTHLSSDLYVDGNHDGTVGFMAGLSAGLMITLDDHTWLDIDMHMSRLWDRAVEEIAGSLPPLNAAAAQVFRVDSEGNAIRVQ